MKIKPNILRIVGLGLSIISLLLIFVSGYAITNSISALLKEILFSDQSLAFIPLLIIFIVSYNFTSVIGKLSGVKKGAFVGVFISGITASFCVIAFILVNYPASFQDGTAHWAARMVALYFGTVLLLAGAFIGSIWGIFKK